MVMPAGRATDRRGPRLSRQRLHPTRPASNRARGAFFCSHGHVMSALGTGWDQQTFQNAYGPTARRFE